MDKFFQLMTKLYPLANYNARIVMVSSVFGIRGMFQINANPNKHDGLNEVEEIGVKEIDYHFSTQSKDHNLSCMSNYRYSVVFYCIEKPLQETFDLDHLK